MFRTLIIVTVLSSLICVGDANSQGNKTNAVTYKGIKFRVSEKIFIEEQKNEGFVCAKTSNSEVRACLSKHALFGGFPAEVTAYFKNDKFISVNISFQEQPDSPSTIIFETLMISKLEDQHGKPDEIEWPAEDEFGGKYWKKIWHKKDHSSVTYFHSINFINNTKLETRYIFLMSKDAEKFSKNTNSNQKIDM